MNFLNTQSKTVLRTLDASVIGFKASAAACVDFYKDDMSKRNSAELCVFDVSWNDSDSHFILPESKRINIGSYTGSPIMAIKHRIN